MADGTDVRRAEAMALCIGIIDAKHLKGEDNLTKTHAQSPQCLKANRRNGRHESGNEDQPGNEDEAARKADTFRLKSEVGFRHDGRRRARRGSRRSEGRTKPSRGQPQPWKRAATWSHPTLGG